MCKYPKGWKFCPHLRDYKGVTQEKDQKKKKKKRYRLLWKKNTYSQLLEGMPPVPTGKDHLQPIFYILWSSVWNCKAHRKKLRLKGLRNIDTQVFIMNTLNEFHSSNLKKLFPIYSLSNADLLNKCGHLRWLLKSYSRGVTGCYPLCTHNTSMAPPEVPIIQISFEHVPQT